MRERAQIHFVSMVDPELAIANPALAGLLESGWKIGAHFVAARSDGQVLALVMIPPRIETQTTTAAHIAAVAALVAVLAGSVSALVQWLLP
jgi:hypothetical protein